jgi:signal transduction histidine kinase
MPKRWWIIVVWGLFYLTNTTSAQESSAAFQQDTAQISVCIEQAGKYFVKQQQDSLLYFVQQGFQLSKKWNITTYHSPLYRNWGHYYRLTNDSDKVLMMYKRAQQWAWRHDNKNEIARNGYSLAIAYNLKLSQSMTKANQAALVRQLYDNLRFSSLYGTTYYLAGTYSLLADIGDQYGNDSVRYYYLAKLLPFLKQSTNDINRLEWMYYSFSLSLYRKDPIKAQQDCQAILNTKIKQDFMFFYVNINVNMLRDCIKFGAWDLATQIADDIQQGDLASMDNMTRYIFYKDLASLYLHAKNYAQATQAVQKAQKWATQIADLKVVAPLDRLQLLENEQKIAEYNKQYPQALALSKRIANLKDSINATYGSFDLLLIEERLTSEQKEREFKQQLQLQRLENQRKAEQNRQAFWLVSIIIVVLSAVILFISRQMKQISKQKHRLEELNQTKNQLFSIIGHDLRSPILSTKISLRRILRQKQPSVDELSVAVQKQIPRLQTLLLTVDNLLHWSQNQQHQPNFQKKEILLIQIIEEVIEVLSESIEVGQITVRKNVPNNLSIYADPEHLRIILRNLIQNAIKFTPAGGQILLEATATADRPTLRIKDTGIGFEQSKNDESKKGTGLGLKLVKELLELNNGVLEIVNTQDTGGEVRLYFSKS